MTADSFDLIVIGSGPGGEKGAAQAAYFGKKVLLVEKQSVLGGACIHTGTVPSKTLRETALFYAGIAQRELWGLRPGRAEMPTVEGFMLRKDRVVNALAGQVRENMVDRHGVTVVQGTGSFEAPGRIRIEGVSGVRTAAAPVILLATGSRPHRPKEVPWESPRCFDSDTILKMPFLPRTLTVIGGGVIACEYACIFAALGIKVTLVERRDRLVPFVDRELGEVLQERMKAQQGIELIFNKGINAYRAEGETVTIEMDDGDMIEADALLYAAGRMGNVDELNLAAAGLEANNRGLIQVNDEYLTSAPGVYAVGDLVGFPALASTSMEQGRIAVCHAFGFDYKSKLAHHLPFAIYTIPELACVGMSEEDCAKQGTPYLVGKTRFRTNPRGQISGDTEGFLKLVFHADTKRLLGAHIVGESGMEMIHLAAAVMHYEGTIDYFIQAVFNYPTLSDTYKYAAYDGLGAFARHHAGEGKR